MHIIFHKLTLVKCVHCDGDDDGDDGTIPRPPTWPTCTPSSAQLGAAVEVAAASYAVSFRSQSAARESDDHFMRWPTSRARVQSKYLLLHAAVTVIRNFHPHTMSHRAARMTKSPYTQSRALGMEIIIVMHSLLCVARSEECCFRVCSRAVIWIISVLVKTPARSPMRCDSLAECWLVRAVFVCVFASRLQRPLAQICAPRNKLRHPRPLAGVAAAQTRRRRRSCWACANYGRAKVLLRRWARFKQK